MYRKLGNLYIPTGMLGLWVSVMKLVFIYCILGYRVYSIIITIKIITPSFPPDTVTTYSCILTTKNIQKNFQKGLTFVSFSCILVPVQTKHTKHFGGNKLCVLRVSAFLRATAKCTASVLSLFFLSPLVQRTRRVQKMGAMLAR